MAHPLPSSAVPPTDGPVFNTLSQEAVDVVLRELNDFFQGYEAVRDFQSAPNPGDPETGLFQQRLFISYQSPEDDRFLPALIARVGNFREYRLDMGNALEALPNGGRRYGGSVLADVEVTVASISTLDLDRLFDYLMLAFFVVKVPEFQRQGVRLVPNSLTGNEMSPIKLGESEYIHRRKVTQNVWLEWFFDLDPGDAPNITNIRFRLVTPGSLGAPVVEKE
jgi:hypothetical protein